MQFQITAVLNGKTGKEIPESSRLVFLEKFLANNFGLSDAEEFATLSGSQKQNNSYFQKGWLLPLKFALQALPEFY